MNLPFIFHSQTIDGLAFNDEQVTVRLKTEALDFDSVFVRIEPDNEEYLVDMAQIGTAGELLLWCICNFYYWLFFSNARSHI